jgi:hypothetical protein
MQWREFIALLVARRPGRSAAGVMRSDDPLSLRQRN